VSWTRSSALTFTRVGEDGYIDTETGSVWKKMVEGDV
jgi:hypothetical protein